MAQGFAFSTANLDDCNNAMIFIAMMNILSFAITLYLRPFLVPMQNVLAILLDFVILIVSIIACSVVNDSTKLDMVASLQVACALAASLFAGLMLLNAGFRASLQPVFGLSIVPRVEIFRRLRRNAKIRFLDKIKGGSSNDNKEEFDDPPPYVQDDFFEQEMQTQKRFQTKNHHENYFGDEEENEMLATNEVPLLTDLPPSNNAKKKKKRKIVKKSSTNNKNKVINQREI